MACTIAVRPIQAMSSIFLPRILFYTIYGRAGPEGPARLSYQHVKEHPASGGTQKTPGRRSPARPTPELPRGAVRLVSVNKNTLIPWS